jgi:hypothetical protein
MIRISVSAAAFSAIAESIGARFQAQGSPKGGFFIWLDKTTANQLEALRGPAEGYSDVILRLAEMEEAL